EALRGLDVLGALRVELDVDPLVESHRAHALHVARSRAVREPVEGTDDASVFVGGLDRSRLAGHRNRERVDEGEEGETNVGRSPTYFAHPAHPRVQGLDSIGPRAAASGLT